MFLAAQGTTGLVVYKAYQKGELVGFVPESDQLLVRQISARFPSQEERILQRPATRQ